MGMSGWEEREVEIKVLHRKTAENNAAMFCKHNLEKKS
jgi:hypothetical protein